MDKPAKPQDLGGVWSARKQGLNVIHEEMTELLTIKESGTLPARFDEMFPVDAPRFIINNIRRSWDDMTDRTAKEFPLYVPPRGDSAAKRKEAEKVEKINYGYAEAGRICGSVGYKSLMRLLSSDLVGLASAVAMVLPNYDYKTPYFVHRDPRTHYAPTGYAPWKQGHLNGTMFAYQETLGALKAKWPNHAAALDRAYNKTNFFARLNPFSKAYDTEAMPVWVGEYYHTDAWYLATLDSATSEQAIVFSASEAGDKGHPGICPVVDFTQPSLTRAKGRSIYADQVALMAALARMITLKLDYYEDTLYGPWFVSETVDGQIDTGTGGVNVMRTLGGEKPFVHRGAPVNPIDADQMIATIEGFARAMNRDPEQFQGMGPAESAKALSELKAGINTTIQDGFWPAFIEGLPRLFGLAMQMDQNLWGNERKSASGHKWGNYFHFDYTPNIALKNYTNALRVEVGIGLGGYSGTVELLQRYQAGTIDLRTLLEQIPDVRDSEAMVRRIQGGKLEELMFAAFATKAEQGLIDVAGIAKLRKRVEEGEDLFDAIEDMNAKGELEKAPEGPPGMEGMPPELLAMLGGAPDAAPGLPSPEVMRRGL